MSDLEDQVAKEAEELKNAPAIPVRNLQPQGFGVSGRCCLCGRISRNLVFREVIHGQERYVGNECCGSGT